MQTALIWFTRWHKPPPKGAKIVEVVQIILFGGKEGLTVVTTLDDVMRITGYYYSCDSGHTPLFNDNLRMTTDKINLSLFLVVFNNLKQIGRPVPTNDIWIKTCRINEHDRLQVNKDGRHEACEHRLHYAVAHHKRAAAAS